MITLPEDHPLAALYDESFVSGPEVFLMEATDAVPDPFTHLRRPVKGQRQKAVLGVAAQFEYEQFSISLLQNMASYGSPEVRRMFVAAVSHPQHATTYIMADDIEAKHCSAVTIPHPELGDNAFHIHYNDNILINKFSLSVVTKIATSMEQDKPAALSDSLISLLTSK